LSNVHLIRKFYRSLAVPAPLVSTIMLLLKTKQTSFLIQLVCFVHLFNNMSDFNVCNLVITENTCVSSTPRYEQYKLCTTFNKIVMCMREPVLFSNNKWILLVFCMFNHIWLTLTKWTNTSHFKSKNIKRTMTFDVGNPGPGLGQAHDGG
jgi:uncharacterized membrane protein YjfL (UPF0719 family)